MTAADLAALPDAELEAMDPLVVNMVVAHELPELHDLDLAKYVGMVDGWAEQIGTAIRDNEAQAAVSSPSYKADPNIWRAGSMAIAIAGPHVGIHYSRDVRMTKHSDLFVPGMIDTKEGTCSNMPILHTAIAWRLGWPMHAVVSADHMWSRWDDGSRAKTGAGSYFNLEATSTKRVGDGYSSFSTPTDAEYMRDLKTPKALVDSGSDFSTLTMRQTLGVFLQQRGGYWRGTGQVAKYRADMALAASCFPQNRDIQAGLRDAEGVGGRRPPP